MTTAPSTIIPKSMAPRLIRFALKPKTRMLMKLMSMDTTGYDAGYGSTGQKRTATAFFDTKATADQYKLAKRVLTSAVKRVDNGVYQAIKAVKDGTFTGGTDLNFNLKNGGIGLGTADVFVNVVGGVRVDEPGAVTPIFLPFKSAMVL